MSGRVIELIEENREEFEKYTERVEYASGDHIFREGETKGDKAYVILTGDVSVLRQVRTTEKELAVISGGDMLGEIALFSVGPRTATARANTDVSALVISRESFERLKADNLPLAYELLESILGVVANRLRTTIQRFEVIYFWLT